MHKKKYHIHLNWIIIALTLLAGILPVMLATILTSQIIKLNFQNEVKTISREFVEHHYMDLVNDQNMMDEVLAALEDNQQIAGYFNSSIDAFSPENNMPQSQLDKVFNQFARYHWIDSIDLVRLDGKVVTSRENIIIPSLTTDEIDYYLSQTLNNSKETFNEGIKKTASIQVPDKSLVSIIKLYRSQEISDRLHQPSGFIILNLSTAHIFEEYSLYRFDVTSQLFITDASQRIIFSYDSYMIGEILPSELNIETDNNFGNLIINIDQQSTYLTYSKMDPSGWKIILTLPTSAIEAKMSGIYYSMGVILLVIILFSIVVLLIASIFLVSPINQIARSLMEMRNATFDLKNRLNGSPITELDEVIHGFNSFMENEEGQQSIKLALKESEARYKALFENSPVAMWEEDFSQVIAEIDAIGFQADKLRKHLEANPEIVIGLISRIVINDINQATLKLYEYEDKQTLLKEAARLFQNVSHESLLDELMAISVRQTKFETSVENSCEDGRVIRVKINWSVYPGHEEKMDRVIVSTVDITEQTQTDKIQSAIFQVSNAASTTENLNELYHSIHLILGRLMPAKNFYIALYNETEGEISFPYFVDEVDQKPEPRKFGDGWTEYVIRTREPMLLSQDTVKRLEHEEGVKTYGYDSVDWLGVPLKVEDRIIGIVAVQSYSEGVRYTDTEKDILVFVSNQIAMAIDRKRKEEELKFTSMHDPLTGLYNRGYFEEEVKRLNSGRLSPVGVIMVDVDDLKLANDTYGHATGDELLIAFSKELLRSFRTSDVIARIGGDEFGVLLPTSPLIIIEKAVERLQNNIYEYNATNPEIPLEFSIGYHTNEDGISIHEALKIADQRMYQHKSIKKD
ncbi:MAG: hypothetical protein C0391_04445 [Anaerolinea sp.]|nr:hypothetical protein [Anaerolinea sp.]